MRAFRLVHDERAFGCMRVISVTKDYLIIMEVCPRAHTQAHQEARHVLRRHDLGWDDSPPKHWDLVVTQ